MHASDSLLRPKREHTEKTMATICGGCGRPRDDGSGFCRFCGATTPGVATWAGPSVLRPGGVASPKKSNNTLLVVLVLAIVVLGGLAGAAVFAVYWVKNKVASSAKTYGIEIPSAGPAHSGKSSAAAQRDPCSLLTAAEMAAATGTAITKARSDGHKGCSFASADGMPGGFVEFEWGGGQALMASARALSKIAAVAPGTEAQSVAGVGDEASFQNGMLTVRKGDDGFRIQLPPEVMMPKYDKGSAPEKTMHDTLAQVRDMEKGLAQKVVSRM
jgi:hypothetical protein